MRRISILSMALLVQCFPIVSTGAVKVSAAVNHWTRGRVVKEWQARTSARGNRRTGRVRIDFEG
ncbi:hypothetical protein HBI23_217980 [Parastagonospora nodorum]|nr:hypothetical protein HBI79_181480 [Parastagonospora nodorum]KAH5401289.1 hypothetical protein HBI47_194390 [Parastagonospora nodorum]KAH5632649.1 hypothetical protein HBI23_217980 [Parastagonospora nodorum]KAH5775672.1 hypothetical protein HBI16_094350 [Parastagonospora nodorum]